MRNPDGLRVLGNSQRTASPCAKKRVEAERKFRVMVLHMGERQSNFNLQTQLFFNLPFQHSSLLCAISTLPPGNSHFSGSFMEAERWHISTFTLCSMMAQVT
ncbi:hypothetical protein H8B06_05810 [Sphingobacterium sp. DN00404]|uniref:Uncharacterized protein n=1 Tax=Sphingobacterium micropteri TaxID=2763501 RepID=A0ABR7YLZ0_9SPHI|nr:hypothetical protein [Sphingobacterium micropteri]MBD1432333.1 hypothetical protein [Sphingobacterium micropteri]